ncbi:MAG: MATE family efflux transporter [Hasllibacter sp.]
MTDPPAADDPPPRPSVRAELRPLLTLALPIVTGLAAATLMGVVDTVMIAPLGTRSLAAAGVTVAVVVIAFSAIYGVLSVVGVRIANGFGARDPGAVAAEVANGLRTAWIVGAAGAAAMAAAFPLMRLTGQPPDVLDAAGGYWMALSALLVPFSLLIAMKAAFDAVDRPWTGTAITFAGVALNVPLNLVLIHGTFGWGGLGLVGAGIGSVLAEGFAALLAWAWWRRAAGFRAWNVPAPWSGAGIARQLREGGPLALAYTAEGASWSVAGLMLGAFGAGALAAHQITVSIVSVTYMIPLGMAAAVSVRIGQATGAGEGRRARAIGMAALLMVVAWSLATTALYLAFGRAIGAALSDDAEVVTLAATLFATLALMQVMDGVQSTTVGALRGLLDTVTPTVVSIVAYWLISLPLAWGLAVTLGLGPAWVWIGYGAGLAVAAIWLPLRFWRLTDRPGGCVPSRIRV